MSNAGERTQHADAPISGNELIEVRQIHEMPDFPEDVQKAAEGFEHRNVVD